MPDEMGGEVQEAVQVVGGEGVIPGAMWGPQVGPEALALIEGGVPQASQERVRDEALAVLARVTPPTAPPEHETGLVVGYVQSGKTVSFETVTALARDNGFPLVIVVAGTSQPLYNQSKDRIRADLRLNTRPDRKWQHFDNPSTRGRPQDAIAAILDEWSDPSVPDAERQTVLITVMKNHQHLANLIDVLTELDLQNVPALVIDDEADQAGLNTRVRAGEESTTYQRLSQLRALIPHHTFLQYTATPQAPLLINLIDILSPNFAEVLTPGDEYVGGRDFFAPNTRLVRTIPANEIPSARAVPNDPPGSLFEAMRVFLLGVAAGYLRDEGVGNRSMLVHPSQATAIHNTYYNWVRGAKEQWQEILRLPAGEPDRVDLVEQFQEAYADLSETVDDLPSFDELLDVLPRAIRRTRVEEVNARPGRTPRIDWRSTYPFILVGGQAMDRGFTVEGLTVTYMPRGMGVGNADTIQQRARFFGYKRRYLGYCRVYLEAAVRNAFQHYVDHEENIRTQLIDLRDRGQPLDTWKRAFFLHTTLRPTRAQVLSLDYMRDNFSDDWFTPAAPHTSTDATVSNRAVVSDFLAQLNLTPDQGHADRTVTQRHLTAEVLLSVAYADLLTQLRFVSPKDSQRFTGLRLQLQAYLERNPNAVCTVYQMSPAVERSRGVDDNGELLNLYQGEAPVEPRNRRGEVYPGDRRIRGAAGVTIQLHRLTITQNDQVIEQEVPTVAVWVPAEAGAPWLVQNQGGG